jgi:hypothetical protein
LSNELLESAFGFTNPHHIINHLYSFKWLWLGKSTIIYGLIWGVDVLSDHELLLTVSNKTFGSVPLAHLRFNKGVWFADVDVSSEIPKWGTEYKGEFKLLR